MAAIAPMVAAATATRVGETVVLLPDPDRTITDPIFRPGVAHHPAATVILLELRAAGAQPVVVRAPTRSTARLITGIAPLGASALTTLLELSPLPFGVEARALFAALGAVPTFYFGVPATALTDDAFVELGFQLASVTGSTSVWLGAVFPDTMTRVPSGWIERIATALASVDPANPWPSQLTLFAPNERRLIVLDHAGRPAEQTQFDIRLSGDTAPRWQRALPAGAFDLEPVIAANPLDGATSLFTPPAGRQFELRASFGAGAIPVQSLLDRSTASLGDGYLAVPPSTGAARLHLQIIDLADWYPPPSTPQSVARFRAGSHLEPLIDGIPAFKRLVQDLNNAGHPGHGAQFTGWAFNRFVLDHDDGRDLVEIASDIVQGGGDVRLLATKFLQDEENFNSIQDPAAKVIALAVLHAGFAAHFYVVAKRLRSDRPAFVLPILAGLAGVLTIALLTPRIEEILEYLEPSGELIDPINALTTAGPLAIHARNPARLRDNPIPGATLPSVLANIIEPITDHVGVYHNKSQLVKFKNTSGGTEHAAYLGGIDINFNRLDTPGHNAPAPYHDVHCRLTGPSVQDAWISFNERWEFDRVRAGGAPPPIPPPALAALALPADVEPHIVRVGRTYFGPNPVGDSTPLPFSPQGERSTYDTLLAAIDSARRFIYIEEQYFTSDGTAAPPNPGEATHHAALLRAAGHCERLIILLPSEADQPWSEPRRRRVISELRAAWGSRLQVGFIQRRPSLGEGSTLTGDGRTRLLSAIDATQTKFRLVPDVRVPKTPFWMWVDGELMLIHSTTRLEVDGQYVTEVDVLRALTPNDPTRWFSTPRPHKRGAPVTHARLASIYVHSKMMVVDDLFVSIGSANLNRRGFFYDGEINAFAVPQRLAAAKDNPARALRCALWAQHLGITPEMGQALFGDAVASADFLLRSTWLGNRFTPLEAFDLKGQFALIDNELATGTDAIVFALKLAGLAVVESETFRFFNTISDPVSFVDPNRIFERF
jgi:phosphatidylserine/phosphatidylglycerophosphate/cardiolipin synthase-like enzyme